MQQAGYIAQVVHGSITKHGHEAASPQAVLLPEIESPTPNAACPIYTHGLALRAAYVTFSGMPHTMGMEVEWMALYSW